ncbi:MAG: 5-formyltetrahydrofolate cyclo-ligase [Candidatus Gastranaerophilaceae bacterium]
MYKKTELRTKAKSIRNKLDIKNLSSKLCEKLKNTKEFLNAQNIMIFYPLKNEINLLELLEIPNKKFYLPKMKGLTLNACPYKLGDKLITQNFGIKEPITTPVSPKILDLVIVPALMIDKNNNRLGYGKGYYDRFITKTNAKTIVCIPNELLIDEIPTESHDKKIDIVIIV